MSFRNSQKKQNQRSQISRTRAQGIAALLPIKKSGNSMSRKARRRRKKWGVAPFGRLFPQEHDAKQYLHHSQKNVTSHPILSRLVHFTHSRPTSLWSITSYPIPSHFNPFYILTSCTYMTGPFSSRKNGIF